MGKYNGKLIFWGDFMFFVRNRYFSALTIDIHALFLKISVAKLRNKIN